MCLEDVFVDVLDSLDGGAHCHIDVGIVLLGKVRVVGHHPSIVTPVPTLGDCWAKFTPATMQHARGSAVFSVQQASHDGLNVCLRQKE